MGVLCLVLVLLFTTLGPPSFVIILMGKKELFALLLYQAVFCSSFAVSWVGLRCVIVIFPDHTHLLFM